MKTTLRRLFNYWLPPGAEVDWDEIERENEEWWRLPNRVVRREGMVELSRLTEEMGGYDS